MHRSREYILVKCTAFSIYCSAVLTQIGHGMRCVVLLLAAATGFIAFGLGAVASYVFGPAMPAMCVLLLVCLAVWVLYDCWERIERIAAPMSELKRRLKPLGLRQRVKCAVHSKS
jgi:hypothetical protein